MNKVYMVTAGEYSDYRIVTAFSDKADAEEFARLHNDEGYIWGGDYRVEEYEVDVRRSQVRRERHPYAVGMTRSGVVVRVAISPEMEEADMKPPRVIENKYRGGDYELWGDVWATSKEHATKIVADIHAQLIADGQWPEVTKPAD